MHLEKISEPVKEKDEVFSSFFEIFSHMERLMDYLMQKRRDEAGWLGVLAAILVWFFGVIGVVIVNLLAGTYATKYSIEPPGSNLIYFGFLLALSLSVGLVAYVHARKRYTKEYIPWKKRLDEIKKMVAEGKAEETSITETIFQLLDRTIAWLPDVVEYKSEEALTYGIIAFLLTALVSANSNVGMPVASLIGVTVWLYFRYEKRKEAVQQIQTLKAWRSKFEEGKDYFLKSIQKGRA